MIYDRSRRSSNRGNSDSSGGGYHSRQKRADDILRLNVSEPLSSIQSTSSRNRLSDQTSKVPRYREIAELQDPKQNDASHDQNKQTTYEGEVYPSGQSVFVVVGRFEQSQSDPEMLDFVDFLSGVRYPNIAATGGYFVGPNNFGVTVVLNRGDGSGLEGTSQDTLFEAGANMMISPRVGDEILAWAIEVERVYGTTRESEATQQAQTYEQPTPDYEEYAAEPIPIEEAWPEQSEQPPAYEQPLTVDYGLPPVGANDRRALLEESTSYQGRIYPVVDEWYAEVIGSDAPATTPEDVELYNYLLDQVLAEEEQMALSNFPEDILDILGGENIFLSENRTQLRVVGEQFQQLSEAEREIYLSATDSFDWSIEQQQQSAVTYIGAQEQLQARIDDYSSAMDAISLSYDFSEASLEGSEEDRELAGFFQIIQDARAAVIMTRVVAPQMLGELWETTIKPHWPRLVATIIGFIAAEMVVTALMAIPEPTFLTKAIAVAMQGMLTAIYGTALTVEVIQTIINAFEFGNTIARANGDPEEIEKASRELVEMVSHALMALASQSALRNNMRRSPMPNTPPPRIQEGGRPIEMRYNPSTNGWDAVLPNSNTIQYLPDELTGTLSARMITGSKPTAGSAAGPATGVGTALSNPNQRSGDVDSLTPDTQPLTASPPTQSNGPTEVPTTIEESSSISSSGSAQEGPISPPQTAPTTQGTSSQNIPPASQREPSLLAGVLPETPVGDLQPLSNSLTNYLDGSFEPVELEAIAQGRALDNTQLTQILSRAGNWDLVKEQFISYPQLMRQFLNFRQQEVLSWAIEVFGSRGDLNVLLSDRNGVILGLLMDLLAAGSVSLSSDIDATVHSKEGNESLETQGVAQLNELARQRWNGAEPGVLFDVNFYTRGHMRSPAFSENATVFSLLSKLSERLEEIRESPQLLTQVEKSEIASTVAEVNRMQGNIISARLIRSLNVGDVNPLQRRIVRLEEELSEGLKTEYATSQSEYGTGPVFDELAETMSLVQQREYWQSETLSTGQSGWDHTRQRLSRTPDTTERFQQAEKIHTDLTAERQQRIDTLEQQSSGNEAIENIEMRANNELYVEYLNRADAKLAEVRSARDAGVSEASVQPLLLQLQDLNSRALFFANEAYMTPAAVEHVVLNLQLEYGLNLPVRSYATSINSQVAFIGEKIENSNGSFGLALWGSAKYLIRIADASSRMQAKEPALSAGLIERTQTIDSYARQLNDIKKNEQLANLEKTQQSEQLAAAHPEVFGSNMAEFKQIVLDLQIDLQVEIQRYLDSQ